MSRITITGRGEPILINYTEETSLLDAMIGQGIYLSADCAGRGTCGKCKLQLLEGELEITSFDRNKLTEQELEQGYRLACKAYPKKDCIIRLVSGRETDFKIITEHRQESIGYGKADEDYAVAVDIGTTTIAASLVGLESKKIRLTDSAINRQRAYGTDVVSRIKASNDGKRELLRISIQEDLLELIRRILHEAEIPKNRLKRIVIAGNTTMGHLLLGYSCQGLGSYPFTPVNISTLTLPYEEVMGSDYQSIPVTILPGISAYVGGDIVAGLLACDFDQAKNPCLLVDLGTNGEMAVGNKDRILVSSAAAGPAFEGGNISCGVGSIAGAICDIEINKEGNRLQTIADQPPIGICGTGVVALVFELLQSKLSDATGLLCEEYFEQGYPVAADPQGREILFTQKDMREFQMAKAAIRAGIETLVRCHGITFDEIDTVYLAGGFGYQMNLEKAFGVGLLPKELSGKIKAVGNSALGGAVKYLAGESASARVDHILGVSGEISLSNETDFNDLYIKHMFFEEKAEEPSF